MTGYFRQITMRIGKKEMRNECLERHGSRKCPLNLRLYRRQSAGGRTYRGKHKAIKNLLCANMNQGTVAFISGIPDNLRDLFCSFYGGCIRQMDVAGEYGSHGTVCGGGE